MSASEHARPAAAAADLNKALVETTLELVRVESVTGDEGELADLVEARLLRTFGRQEVIRHHHSVVLAPSSWRADRPTVTLFGHLDTVPPRQDGPVRVDGERIMGCGVSDMKAGLAIMLELAERLDLDGLGANYMAVFYDREEGAYIDNGLQPVLEDLEVVHRTDIAFCLEPSDNRIQLGSLGGIHCTLTFEGRRAHSARPWQGDNAVHKAGPLIAELAARERRPVQFGDLTFYEVMSVTMLEATGTRNVIPDRFALNLNYRFAPGRSLDEAKADIEQLVAGQCSIEWTDLSPSGPVCLDNPLLAPLLARDDVVVQAKQAWTDVARLGLFGIDAANWGPGESAQAHQHNEGCEIPLIIEGYRLYREYLEGL